MKKIQLGAFAQDRISGFRGRVTGRAEYISGCTQILLVPRVSDDGASRESAWFDEQRLDVEEGQGVITLDNSETPGPDRPAPKR